MNEKRELSVDWLRVPPAPNAILQLVSCSCKTGCKDNRCSCAGHGLPCTDACCCQHTAPDSSVPCMNQHGNDPEVRPEPSDIVSDDEDGDSSMS